MYEGDFYPDYLSGTAYLFTFEMAKVLYAQSLKTPVFHLEDVYLTGFVAEKINLHRLHHPLFFYQFNHKDKCSLRGMISQHQISADQMTEAYHFVTNFTIHCAVPEKNFLSQKLILAQRKRCH
jgi:beta-1,3-galactosyltransferase 1